MKKEYKEVELEIIEVENTDIITLSQPGALEDYNWD